MKTGLYIWLRTSDRPAARAVAWGKSWLNIGIHVVAEVCAGGYCAGRARKRSTRGAERIMYRSAAGAALGMAEKEITVESSKTHLFCTILLTSPTT